LEATGETTVAKAYRLLKAILQTAVDDELIRRNPCRIKGAGQESAPERPVATIDQVYALADAVGPRWRLMVFLGSFATLRPEELAELRRGDVDLDAGTIRITLASPELTTGRRATGDPKSAAGRRTLILPAFLHAELRRHVEWFAEKEPDGLLFVGEKGPPSAGPPSAGSGAGPGPRSVCLRASASTISVTRATPWRPIRGRSSRI
jgi:integrase